MFPALIVTAPPESRLHPLFPRNKNKTGHKNKDQRARQENCPGGVYDTAAGNHGLSVAQDALFRFNAVGIALRKNAGGAIQRLCIGERYFLAGAIVCTDERGELAGSTHCAGRAGVDGFRRRRNTPSIARESSRLHWRIRYLDRQRWLRSARISSRGRFNVPTADTASIIQDADGITL
jgi:hypothetical protein